MFNGQQTFITKLENDNNRVIDFERWSYKKVSTVEEKIKEFYKSFNGLFLREAIKKGAVKLSIYSTEANGKNEKLVKSIPITDIQ